MIDALAPDRSDQPFGKAILPGRGWCGRLVPDAHGAQSAPDNGAIDPVPIADEVVRSLIPRKRFRYLTCNPFGRRICCDVDPDEVSAVEPDDDEGIEQVETDSWSNEQVSLQGRRTALEGARAASVGRLSSARCPADGITARTGGRKGLASSLIVSVVPCLSRGAITRFRHRVGVSRLH